MIRTTGVVATTAIALLVPVGAADATLPGTAERGTSIAGTWKGSVYGDNGAAAGYAAKVTLRKNDRGRWVGRVTYPGTCSGRWTFKGRSGGAYRFRERITRDPAGGETCVSPVNVKARRDGARLKVTWTEPRSGDSATMRAKRV
ncbi:hypothetical protein [Nocardioides sp. Soil805]|uniref:hypothetical protein n=1 Tax=Nocardioides sp. Soil805 TaxID=1736416 RepID=UPI000702CA77|nr:hypothetical protein [Nocardioides sp. Soil805]KRF36433.1 hypothetical protein ASG94_02965 [Nocardioides sp. Soil805]